MFRWWASLQTTLNEKKQARVHERILELLTSLQTKIFPSLKPGKVVSSFRLGEGEPPVLGIKASDVVDGFYSFPGFTRLISAAAIQKAIAEGIHGGVFGFYHRQSASIGSGW